MTMLARLHDAGVHVHLDGDDVVVRTPKPLTDNQLGFLRAHKPEIVADLGVQQAAERARERHESRRQRVLDQLGADPTLTYAYEIDAASHPNYIIMAMAIRDVGSFELSIDRERFDPLDVLAFLVDQHGPPQLCGTTARRERSSRPLEREVG